MSDVLTKGQDLVDFPYIFKVKGFGGLTERKMYITGSAAAASPSPTPEASSSIPDTS